MLADQVLNKDKLICTSVLQVLYIVFAEILEKTFQQIELSSHHCHIFIVIFIHCYINYSWLLYSTFIYSSKKFFILLGNQSLILTPKVSNKCYSSKEIFCSVTGPTFKGCARHIFCLFDLKFKQEPLSN